MYTEDLYHGSNRSRGQEVISEQKMKITTGDAHWLGDGSYLFTEDFQSYKWIRDMFKSRHGHKEINYSNININYLILECKIETKKARVLDLTKSEHKILFDKVRKKMVEMNKIVSADVTEGVTLNYMFNELGFKDEFDLVKAIFILNQKHYKDFKSRLAFLPQEQICIKNPEVVKAIEEFNFESKVDLYEGILKDYYYSSGSPKETSSYRARRSESNKGNTSYKRASGRIN